MKIIQLLPTLSYGDAVGNDTIAIKNLLKEIGYDTKIYAENIDSRLPKGTVENISKIPEIGDEDVIIYHGSTGTDLNKLLHTLNSRKIMIYHNITPPYFFEPYSLEAKNLTEYGINGISDLNSVIDYCIADSEFNKNDLIKMGYKCTIDVCPILIPFSDYEKKPSEKILNTYKNDGYINILFVGRVAPNKCHEDILRSFACYNKCFNLKSRLIFVGSWNGMEKYYEKLCEYAGILDINENVLFTGHIKFDEILSWYNLADVFLCMSEHEGFCVPLVEAMYFNVPIIAYNSSAIPETLGGAGVLIETKEPDKIAWEINKVVKDYEYRNNIISMQKKRLEYFSYKSVSEIMKEKLIKFISNNK